MCQWLFHAMKVLSVYDNSRSIAPSLLLVITPNPMPPMGKFYSLSECCSPALAPSSFYLTVILFSTLESCCRYLAVLCEMADEWHELYTRDVEKQREGRWGEKLTLHDRGLAVAEQGQMSLGYMFMHGTALRNAHSSQQAWVWPVETVNENKWSSHSPSPPLI